MRTFLHLSLLLPLCMVGCQKEESEPIHRIDIPDKLFLLSGDNADRAVRYATNAPSWKAIPDDPWCTVSPDSGGVGTVALHVTATDNPDDTSRLTNIRFITSQAEEVRPVVQRQKNEITIDKNKLVAPPVKFTFTIRVQTKDIEIYQLESIMPPPREHEAPWLYAPIPFAPGKYIALNITVGENPYRGDRTAIIRLQEKGGGAYVDIAVLQYGKD